MGWLYMRDMRGHATPRAYLDNQFTYSRDDHRLPAFRKRSYRIIHAAIVPKDTSNG